MTAIVTYEQMRDSANALVVVFYYCGSALSLVLTGFLLYKLIATAKSKVDKEHLPSVKSKKQKLIVFSVLTAVSCWVLYNLLWGAWIIFLAQAGIRPLGG